MTSNDKEMPESTQKSVAAVEKKLSIVKIFVMVWIPLLILCSCLIQYHRYIPSHRSRTVKINTADDDLIKKVLNIKTYHGKVRKKRAFDINAYREMGWRFTPDEAKHVFEEYYRCLIERKFEFSDKSHVKAILVLEGQSVKLECHACFRPDQDYSSYGFQWQQLRTQDGVLRYVEERERIKITSDMMLTITGVDVSDSGQYFCVQTNTQEYIEIYQLDVVFRERRKTIQEYEIKEKLLPMLSLNEHNLHVFTLWSRWSYCNACNKMGKRKKVGICMVNKIYSNRPIKPFDIPIIALYPDGIPCRSTLLPREISRLKVVRQRPSETIMGDCYVDCPTTPAFITVNDSSGNVIESIEPGYHSMQKKPLLPRVVDRTVIFAKTGEILVLRCPDYSEKHTLIRWQNGSIPLNSLTIQRQTPGRVHIDSINKLHIKGLRQTDTAIYSCWGGNTLISTIQVIMTDGAADDASVVIQKIAIVLTVICLILAVILAVRSRMRKKPK